MIYAEADLRGVLQLTGGRPVGALLRALRKAGSTALRDMRSEASKRVRARKKIKAAAVNRALHLRRPAGGGLVWAVEVSGGTTRVSDYSYRQVGKGVSAEINRGKRSMLPHAFVATMRSGHQGVFLRRGPERLPIFEPLASRPVDALLHKGEPEGVLERGRASFVATFGRVFPLELEKGGVK